MAASVRIGASLLVIGFGILLLVNQRHPRALARIRPTQLVLSSFAVAIAHGAGLMLVPMYRALPHRCSRPRSSRRRSLVNADLGIAVEVLAGPHRRDDHRGRIVAWLVYRYFGLNFVSRGWFNLEVLWAVSLILVGTVALGINIAESGYVAGRPASGIRPEAGLLQPAFGQANFGCAPCPFKRARSVLGHSSSRPSNPDAPAHGIDRETGRVAVQLPGRVLVVPAHHRGAMIPASV